MTILIHGAAGGVGSFIANCYPDGRTRYWTGSGPDISYLNSLAMDGIESPACLHIDDFDGIVAES